MSDDPKVTRISFRMMSSADIRKRSVVEVTNSMLFLSSLPCPAGLMDPRLGTTDRRFKCSTCRHGPLECEGHWGHIEMVRPMYHSGHLSTILKVLRCVCVCCSRLLATPAELEELRPRLQHMEDWRRTAFMQKLLRGRMRCPWDSEELCDDDDPEDVCGAPQPQFAKVGALKLETSWRDKELALMSCEAEREALTAPLTPERVLHILRHVPEDHLWFLGFDVSRGAHPVHAIVEVLPVPPPCIRPSVMATDGSRLRGQDDVTIKLQEILKANQALEKALEEEAAPEQIARLEEEIQAHLCIYFFNDAKVPVSSRRRRGQKGSRKTRMLGDKLKGKKGRIRGNLSGKRVDQCARTVVGSDPTHNIWDLGVPKHVATTVTRPIRVCRLTRAELARAVAIGKGRPGGAAMVEYPATGGGRRVDLSVLTEEEREALDLVDGMVVHRHLRDGDWVLFNRQPTLHRGSMQGHRVYVHDDRTFKISLPVTVPYNADFDGDEMNMHVPQLPGAASDVQHVMCVQRNIVDPQSSKPCISFVMDSIVTLMFLTRRDCLLDAARAMYLTMAFHFHARDLPPPAVLRPERRWTGKQLLSMLLPADLHLEKRVRNARAGATVFDAGERVVLIRRGQLLAGMLCKAVTKTSHQGLTHVLVNQHGAQRAAEFMSDAQRMLRLFLLQRGFSVGLGDCFPEERTARTVRDMLQASFDVASQVQGADGLDATTKEQLTSKLLGSMLTRVGTFVQSQLPRDNGFKSMLLSGSKGSLVNVGQIAGAVCQNNVEGKRILPRGKHARTLPCYHPDDTHHQNYGFVANSYLTGLRFDEYFFHAQGGREGLCDTAVKTASTGYIQRKLVKNMEDIGITEDYSVRDGSRHMIQFSYGGDGMDPTFLEKQTLWTVAADDATIHDRVTDGLPVRWLPLARRQIARLREDRDVHRAANVLGLVGSDELRTTVYVPTNPARWLTRARFHEDDATRLGAARFRRVSDYEEPWRRFEAAVRSAFADDEEQVRSVLAVIVATCHVRVVVADPRTRLAPPAWKWMLDGMLRDVLSRRVVPGEMVGSIGATSIGEPTTQLTLNTFHSCGIGAKNVTLGVPRLQELINTTREIATPTCTAYLTSLHRSSPQLADRCAASVRDCPLSSIVASSTVVHDPDDVGAPRDHDWVRLHRDFESLDPVEDDDADDDDDASSTEGWTIRLELDRREMVRRRMTPVHVEDSLRALFGGPRVAAVRATERLALVWVVRIRLSDLSDLVEGVRSASGDSAAPALGTPARSSLERMLVTSVRDELLAHAHVSGVAGITNATVERGTTVTFDETSGAVVRSDELRLECDGTNLLGLATLPFVDPTRLYSNDLHEMFRVLGIEATLLFICHEIENVLSFDGTYIDVHHLYLLSERMCFDGAPAAMTRHGMRSRSVLMRASFEETQEILYQSAMYARDDPIRGVTEKIMLGRPTRIGSGFYWDRIHADPTLVPTPAPVVGVAPATFKSTRRFISEYNANAAAAASSSSGGVPPLHLDDSSVSSSARSSPASSGGTVATDFAGRPVTPQRPGEKIFVVGTMRPRLDGRVTAAAGRMPNQACRVFRPLRVTDPRTAASATTTDHTLLRRARATRLFAPLRAS